MDRRSKHGTARGALQPAASPAAPAWQASMADVRRAGPLAFVARDTAGCSSRAITQASASAADSDLVVDTASTATQPPTRVRPPYDELHLWSLTAATSFIGKIFGAARECRVLAEWRRSCRRRTTFQRFEAISTRARCRCPARRTTFQRFEAMSVGRDVVADANRCQACSVREQRQVLAERRPCSCGGLRQFWGRSRLRCARCRGAKDVRVRRALGRP